MSEQVTSISIDKSSNTPAPVQVVNATLNAKGEPTFSLPVDVDNIRSTEVVDLDFLLVTNDGQRFLLPQGALQAASNPNAAISFKSGVTVSAADQLKKTDVSKPVEGGSYRINSSDLAPSKPTSPPVAGDEFLQGKESKDPSSEVQSVLEQLEKVSQSLQNASLSQNAQNSEESAGHGLGLGAGKGPGTGASNNNFSTSTAGSPPAIKFTSDNTSTNTESAQRELKGDLLPKVTNVVQWDGSTITNTAFSVTSVNAMMLVSPLKVRAISGDVSPQWSPVDVVKSDLILPGVAAANKVTLTLSGDVSHLPPGFKINDVALTSQSVTFSVDGANSSRLALSWTVAADDATVRPQTFAIGVKFTDVNGLVLSGGDKPITFKYADFRSADDTVGLDAHSNPILNLSAFGMSYDITARDVGGTINGSFGHDILRGLGGIDILNGGGGDDLLIGGAGPDQLDGGTGKNTASYAGSNAGVSVYLDASKQNLNAGGDATGDTLVNITNLIGSSHDDTLVGDINGQGEGIVNTLDGGDGHDRLEGGKGADILIGGLGQDTASYEHAAALTGAIGVTASLADSSVNTGDAAGDVYNSIENLTGSGFNDTLIGDGNNNTLQGLGGDDVLQGGAGADQLDGGTGNNTASYTTSDGGVQVYLNVSNLNAGGDAAGDTLTNIANLTGSAYADILVGDDRANILNGGGGDDVLQGGAGADQLDGGTGKNIASYLGSSAGVSVYLDASKQSLNSGGDAAGDTLANITNLTGSAYADTLVGDDVANILSGGNGDDILIGGNGADQLIGGDGSDTASYDNTSVGLTASLANAAMNTGAAAGDVYSSIENLRGTIGNDILMGEANSNKIAGLSGNDTLQGGAGADQLDGGEDNDTVSYANSTTAVSVSLVDPSQNAGLDAEGDTYVSIENITGSAFADNLMGNSALNILSGNDGDDAFAGLGGGDAFDGGSGMDTVSYAWSTTGVVASLLSASQGSNSGAALGDAYTSIENLTGSSYADTLMGDASEAGNTLNGGLGNDLLIDGTGASADIYVGGAGVDTVSYAMSAAGVSLSLGDGGTAGDATGDRYTGVEQVTGSAFDDIIKGDAAENTLHGSLGNDTLDGGAGADVLDGSDGADTASYAGATTAVTVNLMDAALNVGLDAQGDTYISIENITGSAYADTLMGNTASNVLSGGDGNDIILGLGGGDTFDGGRGIDTVSYVWAKTGVQAILLPASQGSNSGSAAGDTYTNIENLTGSDFADTLIGDTSAVGNTLNGGLANDLLIDGTGSSADIYIGGAGVDTLSYELSATGVSLTLSGGGSAGDAVGDSYTGIEQVVGTAYDDNLEGDTADNILSGGAGNDVLSGSGGNDTLYGGLGNDILKASAGTGTHLYYGGDAFAGAGNDTVSYEGFSSKINVNLTQLDGNTNGVAGSIERFYEISNLIGGSNNDSLSGNALANTLSGGAGDDVLKGLDGLDTLLAGAGDDVLDGGAGADILNGGTGVDTVTYAQSNAAIVVDFVEGANRSTGEAAGDTYVDIEKVLTGAGDDTFYAGNKALHFDGSGGVDGVSYESANVAVNVSLGRDVIAGGTTNALTQGTWAAGQSFENIENLTGSSNDDTLEGNALANTLKGGTGDDALIASVGLGDTLIGEGNGVVGDTASYEKFMVSVVATLGEGAADGLAASGSQIDKLQSIENLTGGSANDTLTGNSGANVLTGGAGDDVLQGRGGADSLIGGDGFDTASYANAATGIKASLASPLQFNTGDAAGDTYASIENLLGSAHADTLIGDAVKNVLSGGAGDDTLNGGDGDDMLLGGAGNDLFTGGAGADLFDGGADTDTVTYAESAVDLTIDLLNQTQGFGNGHGTGMANGDVFKSGTIESVIGGAGNDTFLLPATNAITIDGGSGTANTVSFLYSGAVSASLKAATYLHIQNLTGSSAADTLEGDANANIIMGGNGDDRLLATVGLGDTLHGGSHLVSGDTASYENFSSSVNASLVLGTAISGSQSDTLVQIENITGGSAADILTGDEYANVLKGGGGNDIFNGGAGDDTLYGGSGADTFNGGSGNDTVSYADSVSGITIDMANTALGAGAGTGDAAGDMFNTDITAVQGSDKGDVFYGRNTPERFIGGSGNDTLHGSAGADDLDGGLGLDTIDYTGSTAVSLNFLTNAHSGGYAAGDTLRNIEKAIGTAGNDSMTANDSGMTLDGDAGNDTLSGGLGRDVLIAGSGVDLLNGNGGDDTLDLKTNSTTLAGDKAYGDAGDDVIIISQAALNSADSNTLIDGGTGGNDTLQFFATAGVVIDLSNPTTGTLANGKFNSIETLDMSADGVSSNVILSSAGVIGLVDNGNSSVLTLKLSSGSDTYSIANGETATFGNNSVTLANATNHTTATVNLIYG
jgi:Ca2+-binding RTX toxin-like protein